VQRNAVAVLPHEVLPLLQRAVVEAQEDVEHELGELVRRSSVVRRSRFIERTSRDEVGGEMSCAWTRRAARR
jgi:hypothetical protein